MYWKLMCLTNVGQEMKTVALVMTAETIMNPVSVFLSLYCTFWGYKRQSTLIMFVIVKGPTVCTNTVIRDPSDFQSITVNVINNIYSLIVLKKQLCLILFNIIHNTVSNIFSSTSRIKVHFGKHESCMKNGFGGLHENLILLATLKGLNAKTIFSQAKNGIRPCVFRPDVR